YNNVAYNTSAPVISFENESVHENFSFSNNIFIGPENIISGKNTGSTFTGNAWCGAGGPIRLMGFGSLKAWASATGQETINGKLLGIQADPGLKGPFKTEITDTYQLNTLFGYTLRPDSRLRDKGIDIPTIPGFTPAVKDFFGNSIPQGSAPEPGISELK
ncbi:MAG: hypothetical protein Q8868_08760, partial [Bacteroidota bacterium]|nr:hypothetical protein [Bacteroidota bacterium]